MLPSANYFSQNMFNSFKFQLQIKEMTIINTKLGEYPIQRFQIVIIVYKGIIDDILYLLIDLEQLALTFLLKASSRQQVI